MLDRWLSYTITLVWEFDWVDSALVFLQEWSSYRSGHLKRFDCSNNFVKSKSMINFTENENADTEEID